MSLVIISGVGDEAGLWGVWREAVGRAEVDAGLRGLYAELDAEVAAWLCESYRMGQQEHLKA